MQPDDFRSWRKALGWKQKDAADRLGLKKRVIQYYEKGDRDGKAVEIPRTVELACLALTLGFERYDGGPVERPAAAPPPMLAAASGPSEDTDDPFGKAGTRRRRAGKKRAAAGGDTSGEE